MYDSVHYYNCMYIVTDACAHLYINNMQETNIAVH